MDDGNLVEVGSSRKRTSHPRFFETLQSRTDEGGRRVAAMPPDGRARRTEAHERRPGGKVAVRIERGVTTRREDAEIESQGREPEGREPRGGKPRRGSSVGNGVTATRRDGLIDGANPWSRSQQEPDGRGVEDHVYETSRTSGERRRNGRKGRDRREAMPALDEGKPLKGASPRALRHERRPKGDERNNASRDGESLKTQHSRLR